MKRVTLILALLGTAVVLGSCASVNYVTDFDRNHDFSSDHTFAWYRLPPRPGRDAPRRAPNDIVAARIRRSVTSTLESKGLTSSPAGSADLLVTYNIALQRRMHVYSGGWGHPYYGCCGWGGGGYTTTRVVTEGTLIVDILDAKSRSLVWRGIAEGAFTAPNPDEATVVKIVSRLLAEFPRG